MCIRDRQDTRTCCDPSTINNEYYTRIRSSLLPVHHYIILSEIPSKYSVPLPSTLQTTDTSYREYTHHMSIYCALHQYTTHCAGTQPVLCQSYCTAPPVLCVQSSPMIRGILHDCLYPCPLCAILHCYQNVRTHPQELYPAVPRLRTSPRPCGR